MHQFCGWDSNQWARYKGVVTRLYKKRRCYRWTWIWRTQWDQENWSVICKIRSIHMTNTCYVSDWDQAYRPSYAKIRHTVVRHIQVHLYKELQKLSTHLPEELWPILWTLASADSQSHTHHHSREAEAPCHPGSDVDDLSAQGDGCDPMSGRCWCPQAGPLSPRMEEGENDNPYAAGA